MTPASNSGAYDHLVSKVWSGDMSHFVATDTLLASWRLWTPLLNELDGQKEAPPLYKEGGAAMHDAIRGKWTAFTSCRFCQAPPSSTEMDAAAAATEL